MEDLLLMLAFDLRMSWKRIEKGQPMCDDSVAMDERLQEDFCSARGPSN
jgi:hypothetical protein